jgi:hypothetical protein
MSGIGGIGGIGGISGIGGAGGGYPPAPHGLQGQSRPANTNAPSPSTNTSASTGTTSADAVPPPGATTGGTQSSNSTQGNSTLTGPPAGRPPPEGPPPPGNGSSSAALVSHSIGNSASGSDTSSATQIIELKKQLTSEQTKLLQDVPTVSPAAQLTKQGLQVQIAAIEAQIAQVQLGKTINVTA